MILEHVLADYLYSIISYKIELHPEYMCKIIFEKPAVGWVGWFETLLFLPQYSQSLTSTNGGEQGVTAILVS